MPLSREQILAHADELATELEAFDPATARRVTGPELELRKAAVARALAEREASEAVEHARAEGMSWRRIGKALGISAQSAHTRYAKS